jgi:hypothetical protein
VVSLTDKAWARIEPLLPPPTTSLPTSKRAIIEQELMRVDHTMSAEEFAAHGREVECRALARAVRWHTENRVALNGTKTVVLP